MLLSAKQAVSVHLGVWGCRFMCDLKHRRKPFATVLLEEETAAGDSPRTVLWIGVHAPSSSFCRQTGTRPHCCRCRHAPHLSSALASSSSFSVAVSTNEVLYALNHTCVAMPAGWWTYEMCFGKQLRQFHAEGTTSTQYILGKPGPDSATVVDNMGSASLVMNYGDGTTCDLTGQPRTTKVSHHGHGYHCLAALMLLRVSPYRYCTCFIPMFCLLRGFAVLLCICVDPAALGHGLPRSSLSVVTLMH